MARPEPTRWARGLLAAAAIALAAAAAAQQHGPHPPSAAGAEKAAVEQGTDDAAIDRPAGSAGAGDSASAPPGSGSAAAGDGVSSGEEVDAEALMRKALELRAAGKLPQAAALLRQAMEAAGDDAGLRSRIHRELYFHLPVLEAQRLLLLSRPAQARRVVEQAIEYNRNHAAESEQLREFLRNIRRLEAQDAGETEGASVLREVGDRLNAFHRRAGRYPSGYTELNELLPAERPPLEYFDIVYYAAGTDTFTLRLRSRIDPGRILTLHQTGLLR